MDADLERVLEYEPRTFDKHLVIFQRIDKATTVSSLAFNECTFWVQIHDLPFKSMTRAGYEYREFHWQSSVCVAESDDDGVIGRYLHVHVTLDISKPLSRGRKLKENSVAVGWVSFHYERILNFCFWCGCLMHKDRCCNIQLNNKGKSPMEKQQFGPWLRAGLERLVRRTTATSAVFDQVGVLSVTPVTKNPAPTPTSNSSTGRSTKEASKLPAHPQMVNPSGESVHDLHENPLALATKNFEKTL